MIGATLILPSDRYPYVVVRSTRTTFVLCKVSEVDTTTGHKPAYYNGPFPVWDHTYTEDELERLMIFGLGWVVVRRHQDGGYYDRHGNLYSIGVARYHRDYSD